MAFLVAALLGWLPGARADPLLYQRPLDTLLATWGVALILEQAAKNIFGAPNVTVATPAWLDGALPVTEDLSLSYARLFILGLSILALGGVYFYLYRTHRAGWCAPSPESSHRRLPRRTYRPGDALDFALGTGLAGLAGAALCLLGPVGPFIGTDYIVQAFMVVVLGGVGQLIGTVAAAAAIGGLSTVFNLQFSVSASVRRSCSPRSSPSCSSARRDSSERGVARWRCARRRGERCGSARAGSGRTVAWRTLGLTTIVMVVFLVVLPAVLDPSA